MTKPYKTFNVRLDLATSEKFESVLRAEIKQGVMVRLVRRFIAEREAENAGVAQ